MLTLVRTFVGGNVLYLGIGAALVTLVIGWDSSRKANWVNRGVEQERASVEKRGEINARKADEARRGAERLPASRLRDTYCRDC
jgi:hypothetical protein